MALTDYTTYAEVRSVLGVSTTELPDTVLAQEQWLSLFNIDAEDIHSNLLTEYAAISALPSLSRTAAQKKLYELVRLFASYTSAKNLFSSLELFSAVRLGDGRAEFERTADPYDSVRNGVLATLAKIIAKLTAAYQVFNPAVPSYTTPTYSHILAAGLAKDPVTARV